MAKKLKYDMKRDEVNKNNGVKFKWFIVPEKVGQINDYFFIGI